MKISLVFAAVLFTILSTAQKGDSKLKMTTDYSSENAELRDILNFEGIDLIRMNFAGKELKNKSFHITVKEIWDGKIVKDTTVWNSMEGIEQFQKISDTTFSFKVLGKLTPKNKLKMTFRFKGYSITKYYDATDTPDYSLRNIADESKMEISYNKKFYLLAYILPYERKDGSKSWCEVGSAGKDLEKWGEKFGIKHYLLFEMKFE